MSHTFYEYRPLPSNKPVDEQTLQELFDGFNFHSGRARDVTTEASRQHTYDAKAILNRIVLQSNKGDETPETKSCFYFLQKYARDVRFINNRYDELTNPSCLSTCIIG